MENAKEKEAPQASGALPKQFTELEEAAKPLYRLLKKRYNPHCSIIVDENGVRVVSDEVFQPLS